ncbi:MAG: polysaccharide biosynthesis tyrosine autokinase [Polyangiaceae bacterium]|nr:polysaccharide biosynthesis tyrosine autokinase [Polyangiaceae bacterium]
MPELQPSSDLLAGLTSDVALKALRKHWLMGLVVAAGVFFGTTFYTLGQKKIYRSTATVQIEPTPPRPLGKDVQNVVDMGVGSYWSNKEYYATQQKLLQSRALAVETVKKLALHRNLRFLANAAPGEANPPAPEREYTVEDAADVLLGRLKVEPMKDSRLVVVNFEDADPERSSRVLATLVDLYLERNVEQVVASTDEASQWLRDQVAKLKQELESSELALHDYKKDKRILSVSLDDQSNMLREEMQQLNQALTAIQTRREALKARYNELSKIDAEDPDDLPATELLANPLLNTLRAEYVHAKAEYAAIMGSGKGERHPEVAAVGAKLEPTRQALLAEIRNVQGAAKSDLDAASRETAGLSSLFEQAKQRAMDLNMLEIEFRRLERSKDNTEKLYSLVLERSKESDLTGLMRFNNITVVEPARAGRVPVKPRVPLSLALGMMAGVGLGLGLVLARELLDRRVRTPEELEIATGLAFFGLLPSGERARSAKGHSYGRRGRHRQVPQDAPLELIAHHASAGAMAEAARRIRTNLLFSSPDHPHRRILITSANPGEGKTMVASTLAIALAQTGRRVLLVDCDLRRPRLHRIFEVTNDVGVSSSVVDHGLLTTASLTTAVPNLSLLPSGPMVATPAELLQSSSFQALLDELGSRYDTLVLDSPPVGVVTDAAVVAPGIDATILVARAGKTSRDLAARAARTLRDVGAHVVGCVLNDVDLNRRGYYGSYYYQYYHGGYGYGSTGAEAGDSVAPPRAAS